MLIENSGFQACGGFYRSGWGPEISIRKVERKNNFHLPHPGIKPMTLMSLALAGRFFTAEPLEKPQYLGPAPGS